MHNRRQAPYLKFWIILIIGLVFFVNSTFAANSCSPEAIKWLDTIKNLFMRVGDIASWIWLLLGNVAGKLMTNTLIYGEFLHFDTFLWKIWQISRTFANYAIGFLFLYHILRYLLSPTAKETPTNIIKELLISSVLIQASWFLVMVTVDLSTIGLATISSFPSQVIANSQHLQNHFITEIKANKIIGSALKSKPEMVYLSPFTDDFEKRRKQFWWEHVSIDKEALSGISIESLGDNLTPKADNLAWPLTYLGFTVFKTHNFLKEYNIKDANCVELFTKIMISLVLDAGMIILYAFALAILIVVLIVRVVYLWVFIALSPIIVLASSTKLLDLGKISSFLDIKKILKLIFQPVVFALWISIMFLFIVVVQGFFHTQNGNIQFDDGSIKLKESSQTTNGSSASYKSELTIGETAKVVVAQWTKSLGDILLAMLSLAMMWYLIKLAVTSKTGIDDLDKFTTNITNLTERAVGNIGVIPTPAGNIGFKQIWNNDSNSSPILTWAANKYDTKLSTEQENQMNRVKTFFGIKGETINSLKATQGSDLERAMKSTDISSFPKSIKTIKEANNGIKFTEIKPYLINWIDNNGTKTSELRKYFGDSYTWSKITSSDANKTEENLKNMFSNSQVVQQFYKNILWGTRDDIMSYEQLNSSLWDVKTEN